jgi:hypothetical protein
MPDEPAGNGLDKSLPTSSEAPRIGVYTCYCGGNISDAVDCELVARMWLSHARTCRCAQTPVNRSSRMTFVTWALTGL